MGGARPGLGRHSGSPPWDPFALRCAAAILTVVSNYVCVPAVYPESRGTVTFDWVAEDSMRDGSGTDALFGRGGPDPLYQDDGLVASCCPGSFVQRACTMRAYPVGEVPGGRVDRGLRRDTDASALCLNLRGASPSAPSVRCGMIPAEMAPRSTPSR